MRVTTSLDLVSRCRVYARDPREPKTRRPGCIKTSPNQKSNGKNGTGRGKLPGPFLSVPSKATPQPPPHHPSPHPERRHGSMSALLHAQCSVRMRTYVCSGCWMWAPAPVLLRRDHIQGICMGSSRLAAVRGHRTAHRPGFSSTEIGPDRKMVSTLPRTFIGRGRRHPIPVLTTSGFCDHAIKSGSGGGGWTRSRVRRSTMKSTSTDQCSYDVRRREDDTYKSGPSSSLRVGCMRLQNLNLSG